MSTTVKIYVLIFFSILCFSYTNTAYAQEPQDVITESIEPTESEVDTVERPLDDIVEKRHFTEKRLMPWDPVREADILWEKRVWRVIEAKEKINQYFRYPESDQQFINILLKAVEKGDIKAYGNDKFEGRFTADEIASKISKVDTVRQVDPETYEEKIQIVRNDFDPNSVTRFRLKEIWYFDRETSTLKVRIMGIAPIKDLEDDNGNFLAEEALFWVYYPDCREIFSRHRIFMPGANMANQMTWEDAFEMRLFNSYIIKASNVLDYRLQDQYSGVDLLQEGEKI